MVIQSGVDHGRCQVIRNGVDSSVFHYLDKNDCRKKLGLPIERKILLSVGGLIFRKGFDRIIRSLPIVSQQYMNVIFFIVGEEGPEGRYKKELLDLACELKVSERVVFIGKVKNTELNLWYNAADLFVLASRGEGSPNVLTEALAAGCPSVGTSVGAVPDIIASKEYGRVCVNSNNITSCMLAMLSMVVNREKISIENGKFSWDWCARKIITVIGQVEQDINEK